MHSLRGGRSFFVHFKHRSTDRGFSQVRLTASPLNRCSRWDFLLNKLHWVFGGLNESLTVICFVHTIFVGDGWKITQYSEVDRYTVKIFHFGLVYQFHRYSRKTTQTTISKLAECSFAIWPVSLIMGKIFLLRTKVIWSNLSGYFIHVIIWPILMGIFRRQKSKWDTTISTTHIPNAT